jgi:hypothetical protein
MYNNIYYEVYVVKKKMIGIHASIERLQPSFDGIVQASFFHCKLLLCEISCINFE